MTIERIGSLMCPTVALLAGRKRRRRLEPLAQPHAALLGRLAGEHALRAPVVADVPSSDRDFPLAVLVDDPRLRRALRLRLAGDDDRENRLAHVPDGSTTRRTEAPPAT